MVELSGGSFFVKNFLSARYLVLATEKTAKLTLKLRTKNL
jgi:hypothetical protein